MCLPWTLLSSSFSETQHASVSPKSSPCQEFSSLTCLLYRPASHFTPLPGLWPQRCPPRAGCECLIPFTRTMARRLWHSVVHTSSPLYAINLCGRTNGCEEAGSRVSSLLVSVPVPFHASDCGSQKPKGYSAKASRLWLPFIELTLRQRGSPICPRAKDLGKTELHAPTFWMGRIERHSSIFLDFQQFLTCLWG